MPKETVSQQLYKFFSHRGKGNRPRADSLDNFTSEEIVQLISLIRGRNAHEIIVFANTYRVSSKEVTVQDIDECRRLLKVSEVQEG